MCPDNVRFSFIPHSENLIEYNLARFVLNSRTDNLWLMNERNSAAVIEDYPYFYSQNPLAFPIKNVFFFLTGYKKCFLVHYNP